MRFASVYRKFGDIAEFEAELERLDAEPPLQREHLFERPPRPVPSDPRVTLLRYPLSRAESVAEGGLVGVTEGNSDSRRGS